MLETFGLHQIIKEPTRVTENSRTFIDHMYVTKKDTVLESHVMKYSLSDPYPICISKKKIKENKKHSESQLTCRNFKNFNENAFLDDLSRVPFHLVEFESDLAKAIKLWYNIFNDVINKHVPVVTKMVD